MGNQIKAVITDDETISIDGRTLLDRDALVDALRSALQHDPGVILVIAPQKNEYYKGIGKVIYASQAVGFPVENLRFAMEDGDVVSFDELQAQSAQ
jgi:biopolymer transport protein ExbD